MINLPFKGIERLGIDTQIFTGQVANNSLYLGFVCSPALAQLLEFTPGLLTHQHMHSAPACQQLLYEKSANKSGATGQEIIHQSSTLLVAQLLSIHAGPHTTKVLG